VTRRAKVVTVHYHELVPMLLDEIQKLSAKAAEDRQRLSSLEQKMQAKNANCSFVNASRGD